MRNLTLAIIIVFNYDAEDTVRSQELDIMARGQSQRYSTNPNTNILYIKVGHDFRNMILDKERRPPDSLISAHVGRENLIRAILKIISNYPFALLQNLQEDFRRGLSLSLTNFHHILQQQPSTYMESFLPEREIFNRVLLMTIAHGSTNGGIEPTFLSRLASRINIVLARKNLQLSDYILMQCAFAGGRGFDLTGETSIEQSQFAKLAQYIRHLNPAVPIYSSTDTLPLTSMRIPRLSAWRNAISVSYEDMTRRIAGALEFKPFRSIQEDKFKATRDLSTQNLSAPYILSQTRDESDSDTDPAPIRPIVQPDVPNRMSALHEISRGLRPPTWSIQINSRHEVDAFLSTPIHSIPPSLRVRRR